jgi:vacuolar-type H+-ATPase subunit I/STV1
VSSEADTQARGSQAETEGEGREPTTEETQQSQADENAAAGQEPREDSVPASEFKAYKKKTDAENKNLRRERNELKARLDAIDNEKLSEQEKLDKRREELESGISERDGRIAELEGRLKRSAFIEQIGLPSPRLAWASVSDLGLSAEFDEDMRLTNKKQLAKALKDEFPREFGNGSADGGERADASAAQDMNTVLRSMRRSSAR